MKYLSGIIYYCVVDGDENDGEGTAEELQGSQKPKKVYFITSIKGNSFMVCYFI